MRLRKLSARQKVSLALSVASAMAVILFLISEIVMKPSGGFGGLIVLEVLVALMIVANINSYRVLRKTGNHGPEKRLD